jgi:hypothetical protein
LNDEAPAVPDPEYKVVVTGPGMEVERQISESVALSILSVVMGGGRGAASRGTGADEPSERIERGSRGLGMSEGEFLEESGAKKNFQKVTALGYFIEEELQQESFTRNDVREAFDRAREPMPGNFARDFGVAVEATFIAEVRGSNDQFHLTSTGRKAVAAKFSKEVAPRTRRRRKPKASGNGEGKAAE